MLTDEDKQFSRPDKRQRNQLRALQTERGLLNRADGSCRLSQDGTTILAAVYGPMQVGARQEKIDRATIEVVLTPIDGQISNSEVHMAELVRSTVETLVLTTLHPRTKIVVALQILSDDGSVLAACLNAACFALIDAGVQCNTMFGAVTVAIDDQNQLLIDPSFKEQQNANTVLTAAFSGNGDLLMSWAVGCMSDTHFADCLAVGRKASQTVITYFKMAVVRTAQPAGI